MIAKIYICLGGWMCGRMWKLWQITRRRFIYPSMGRWR